MSASPPWRGGAIALAMTGGVVGAAFLLISGLQDPDRPMSPDAERLLEEKRAAFLAGSGEVIPTPSPACSPESLVLVGSALDADGSPATEFTSDQDLRLAVAIHNPCTDAVAFQTPSACLAPAFTLHRPDGTAQPGGSMCAQMISDWEVEAGGAQRASFAIGNLPAGAYSAEIPVPGLGRSASMEFVVR